MIWSILNVLCCRRISPRHQRNPATPTILRAPGLGRPARTKRHFHGMRGTHAPRTSGGMGCEAGRSTATHSIVCVCVMQHCAYYHGSIDTNNDACVTEAILRRCRYKVKLNKSYTCATQRWQVDKIHLRFSATDRTTATRRWGDGILMEWCRSTIGPMYVLSALLYLPWCFCG